MAQFPKIQLTRLGKNIILAGQNKQKVTFTKVELGDGLLGGQSVDDMTALVHSVMSLPLQKFLNNGDGSARLRFVLDNNNLAKGFFNREIGVFAKIDDGEEQLYAYTNAGNLADYIPDKESPISSKIINLHIIVGNAMNLTIVAENSAYVTKLDMDSHKAAVEIDHPDASVTTPKIRDGAVTSVKIAERAIEKKHLRKGGIVAGDIGAYSKEDVNKLLADHRTKTPLDHPDGSVLKKHLGFEVYDKGEVYNKNEIAQSYRKIGNRIVSGDVDWNTLTEPTTYKIQSAVMGAAHHAPPNEYNHGLLVVNRLENGVDGEWRTVQIYFPHSLRGYWSRMYNGPADYLAEYWLEWRYIPTHNEVETIAEQKASTKVSKNGDTISGRLIFAHDTNNPESNASIRSIFPAHYYHNYWQENDRSVYIHAYPNVDLPQDDTRFAFRIGEGNKRYHEYVLGKDGFQLNGKDLWASNVYASYWFRVSGENSGIYWEKHEGGWHMTDKEWIRAWGGKGIYTSGKIRCDAGFEGTLRGTADNANGLQGKDVNHFYRHLGGREMPTLVPLVDWERMKQENGGQDVRNINNPAAGIVAYGGDTSFDRKYSNGTILLKQSYKNFDKILVCCSDDDGGYSYNALWDKWEMEFMFANAYRFDIAISKHCYWQIFGNKRGSSNAPLSTETLWRGSDQDCGLIEIYGVYY